MGTPKGWGRALEVLPTTAPAWPPGAARGHRHSPEGRRGMSRPDGHPVAAELLGQDEASSPTAVVDPPTVLRSACSISSAAASSSSGSAWA